MRRRPQWELPFYQVCVCEREAVRSEQLRVQRITETKPRGSVFVFFHLAILHSYKSHWWPIMVFRKWHQPQYLNDAVCLPPTPSLTPTTLPRSSSFSSSCKIQGTFLHPSLFLSFPFIFKPLLLDLPFVLIRLSVFPASDENTPILHSVY